MASCRCSKQAADLPLYLPVASRLLLLLLLRIRR